MNTFFFEWAPFSCACHLNEWRKVRIYSQPLNTQRLTNLYINLDHRTVYEDETCRTKLSDCSASWFTRKKEMDTLFPHFDCVHVSVCKPQKNMTHCCHGERRAVRLRRDLLNHVKHTHQTHACSNAQLELSTLMKL